MTYQYILNKKQTNLVSQSLKIGQLSFGILVIVGICAVDLINPYNKPFISLFLASVITILGFFPLYFWLGNSSREAIPLLQMHGVFYAISFGVVGFIDNLLLGSYLDWVGEYEKQIALLFVFIGLTALYSGFYMGSVIFGKKMRWRWRFKFQIYNDNGYSFFVFLAFPLLAVVKVAIDFFEIVPLLQVVLILYNFSFYLLIYAYFSNNLKLLERQFFLFLILPYHVFWGSGFFSSPTGLAIAGFATTLINIEIAYILTNRKISYFIIMFIVGGYFFMQPIKGDFRQIMISNNHSYSMIEKMQLMTDMVWSYYFETDSTAGSRQIQEGLDRSQARFNHLVTTAAVIADTPKVQPFIYGSSYIPLLTKWIPRALWIDKPVENFGNLWAKQYGYLNVNDYVTSFNLPWLPEMYMNFGIAGVLGINFLLGILFYLTSLNFCRNIKDSSSFSLGLLISFPLMFVESNLSMTFGGLITVFVTIVLAAYFLTKFFPNLFAWD